MLKSYKYISISKFYNYQPRFFLYYLKKFRLTRKKVVYQPPRLWTNLKLKTSQFNGNAIIILALESSYIQIKELEFLRVLVKRKFKNKVKIQFQSDRHTTFFTTKPVLTRMGKGIGNISEQKFFINNNEILMTLFIKDSFFVKFLPIIKYIQSRLPFKSKILCLFNRIV